MVEMTREQNLEWNSPETKRRRALDQRMLALDQREHGLQQRLAEFEKTERDSALAAKRKAAAALSATPEEAAAIDSKRVTSWFLANAARDSLGDLADLSDEKWKKALGAIPPTGWPEGQGDDATHLAALRGGVVEVVDDIEEPPSDHGLRRLLLGHSAAR